MTLRTHYTGDLSAGDDGKAVTLAGWVDEKRDIGNLIFLVLRDMKGRIQVTGKKGATDAHALAVMKDVKKESVVLITGTCVRNDKAPRGIELSPLTIELLSPVSDVLPIDMTGAASTSLDKRLDARPLDLRDPKHQAIFRVQSMLIQEMQHFLAKRDFLQIFTPCLMGVASESGAEVFPVVYFHKEAFLRQDPQLHRQLAIAGGLERVYDVGPAWRAEPSHTTTHLCEHRVMAAEMAFIKDEREPMKLQEDLVTYAVRKLQQDCKDELARFDASWDVKEHFPVLEFPAIYDILDEFGEPLKRGDDITKQAEKKLGEYVKERYKSDFFFINRFPFAAKPFYVMRYDDDPLWARSTDLIFRGIEMSSGGQREHRHGKIMEQARLKGMKLSSVEWFSDFFKYGVPPHGGFALGIERLTMQLLGLDNVREATLFPRDTDRLTP